MASCRADAVVVQQTAAARPPLGTLCVAAPVSSQQVPAAPLAVARAAVPTQLRSATVSNGPKAPPLLVRVADVSFASPAAAAGAAAMRALAPLPFALLAAAVVAQHKAETAARAAALLRGHGSAPSPTLGTPVGVTEGALRGAFENLLRALDLPVWQTDRFEECLRVLVDNSLAACDHSVRPMRVHALIGPDELRGCGDANGTLPQQKTVDVVMRGMV